MRITKAQRNAVAEKITSLERTFYGRGPRNVQVSVSDDDPVSLVVLSIDSLTVADAVLRERGYREAVIRHHEALHEATRAGLPRGDRGHRRRVRDRLPRPGTPDDRARHPRVRLLGQMPTIPADPLNWAGLPRSSRRTSPRIRAWHAELIGRDHPAGGAARRDRPGHRRATAGWCWSPARPGSARPRWSPTPWTRRGGPGALVLSGSCWDSAAAPGYWPWVQVHARAAAAGAADEWAATRARRRGGAAGGAARRAGATPADGFRLYDAVTAALVAASQRRPVVVVLDDLHWADPASLRLLEFAAQHTWFERLLLVGTYRDVEVEADRPPAARRCCCRCWPRPPRSRSPGSAARGRRADGPHGRRRARRRRWSPRCTGAPAATRSSSSRPRGCGTAAAR